MDVLSASTIDTRIVYGFKGAGKTTYISDCILSDFYYKRGTTLVLSFEQGLEEYDTEALLERRAFVSYYDGNQDIKEFCLEQIEKYDPGRIYVEMSTRLLEAREQFPEIMNVTYTVTWFDWDTLDIIFGAFKQKISLMVTQSQQITFRDCPSKELLIPYSQEFRLMNPKASYLRQDPLGFHEKAFDLFVPYSLDEETITLSEEEFLFFWLDALDHPEHYEEKRIILKTPLELRRSDDCSQCFAGRIVMTCCMADLQFMSFELIGEKIKDLDNGWITFEAIGRIGSDEYGRRVLKLEPQTINASALPASGQIMQTRAQS